MVMNGFDTDGDGENNFYTVNGRPFYYAKYPITVRRSQTVRIYLANLTEFDLINSFHLHGDFFRYYPTGTSDPFEYTDTVMLSRASAGSSRSTSPTRARSCSTRTSPSSPSSAGWASSTWSTTRWRLMASRVGEARRRPGRAAGGSGRSCRSCCSGRRGLALRCPGRLARRARREEPAAGGRVRHPPGRVQAGRDPRPGAPTPQPDDLTIASVTVDDAIVPFTLEGPTTLGRLRSATIVVPFDWVEDDPYLVGVTSSTGIETTEEVAAAVETQGPAPRASSATRSSASSSASCRSRSACLAPVAARRASPKWLAAFMALTAGLSPSSPSTRWPRRLELQAALPGALRARGSCSSGWASSYLALT